MDKKLLFIREKKLQGKLLNKNSSQMRSVASLFTQILFFRRVTSGVSFLEENPLLWGEDMWILMSFLFMLKCTFFSYLHRTLTLPKIQDPKIIPKLLCTIFTNKKKKKTLQFLMESAEGIVSNMSPPTYFMLSVPCKPWKTCGRSKTMQFKCGNEYRCIS